MSKIILCCPFYNENLVANINLKEASKWVDEVHFTECNKSFKYRDHEYCFHLEEPNIKFHYHKIDGTKDYLPPKKKSLFTMPYVFVRPVSRWMKHYCYDTAWYNNGVSRNNTLWNSNYEDEDILVLSDVDEIVDSRYADEIIETVKKLGIVTIKIHFTMFFFNLFCTKWTGPADYSHRIFIVRGDVMRNKFYNDSDYLRKMGESGKLTDTVYCFKDFKGFHHSWLGDEKFVANKILSYSEAVSHHNNGVLNEKGEPDINIIKKKILNREPVFANAHLTLDDSIHLLPIVDKLRNKESSFFL